MWLLSASASIRRYGMRVCTYACGACVCVCVYHSHHEGQKTKAIGRHNRLRKNGSRNAHNAIQCCIRINSCTNTRMRVQVSMHIRKQRGCCKKGACLQQSSPRPSSCFRTCPPSYFRALLKNMFYFLKEGSVWEWQESFVL